MVRKRIVLLGMCGIFIVNASGSSASIGIAELGADSIAATASPEVISDTAVEPMVEYSERAKITPAYQAPPRLGCLHPLAFPKTQSFGFECAYFYYKEMNLLRETAAMFEETYGYPPLIRGEPKSTEYGLLTGFSYSTTRTFGHSGWFLQPRVSPIVGLVNTYDGSEQGEEIVDDRGNTIGVEFKSASMQKTNIFLTGSLLVGYGKPKDKISLAYYSGLRAKLWYRSMESLEATGESLGLVEMYLWFNLPIGVTMFVPMTSSWTFSADFSIDLMISGTMMTLITNSEYSEYFDFPNVTLGNKAGYKLECAFMGRVASRLFLRIAPYIQLYGFGKSNTETATLDDGMGTTGSMSFYEPKSGTIQGGVSLTLNLPSIRIEEARGE